jgi:hypothetical protein
MICDLSKHNLLKMSKRPRKYKSFMLDKSILMPKNTIKSWEKNKNYRKKWQSKENRKLS